MLFKEKTIKAIENIALFEMAYDRKQFKALIENLSYQIYENWCLIKYCSITGNKKQLKNHWKNKLRSYLTKICKAVFKLNRTNALKEVLIDLMEFDNNKDEHLFLWLYDKFFEEGIDIYDEQETINEIIEDWQIYGLEDIIEILANSKNIIKIRDYIDSI